MLGLHASFFQKFIIGAIVVAGGAALIERYVDHINNKDKIQIMLATIVAIALAVSLSSLHVPSYAFVLVFVLIPPISNLVAGLFKKTLSSRDPETSKRLNQSKNLQVLIVAIVAAIIGAIFTQASVPFIAQIFILVVAVGLAAKGGMPGLRPNIKTFN